MAATHVIRTTFRPTDEITVSHDEYEDLLERGLIYDGTPPDPVADPLDARLADRLADPDSNVREVIDGLVGDSVTAYGEAATEMLPLGRRVLTEPDHLRRFQGKLADSAFGRASLLVFGTSIGWGEFANDSTATDTAAGEIFRDRGYVGRTRALLAGMYGEVGEGVVYAYDTRLVVSGGAVRGGNGSSMGLWGRRIQLSNATQQVTYTTTPCTEIRITGQRSSTTPGPLTYTVDGGAPITSATGIGGAAGRFTDVISGLAEGQHTVVISGPATGTGSVYFLWLETYEQSGHGVAVHRIAQPGQALNDAFLLPLAGTQTWADALGPVYDLTTDGDCVVLEFSVNNLTRGFSTYSLDPDEVEAQYRAICNQLVAAGLCVLLVAGPPRDPTTFSIGYTQDDYDSRLREIAADTDHVACLDVLAAWGSYAEGDAAGYEFDEVHPTRLGHAVIAKLISEALFGASVGPTDAGLAISSSVPQPLGTPAAGASGFASDAGHVHAPPALDDLTDVAVSGATNGQVLARSGASWVPATPAAGSSISASAPAALSTSTAAAAGATGEVADAGHVHALVGVASAVDPLGLGFPWTIDPRLCTASVLTSGATYYARIVQGGKNISAVGFFVGVSSGNMTVGVYRNTGTGRAAAPNNRVASGTGACPAAGYGSITLTAPVDVQPGDWLAVSLDNATASLFRQAATNNILSAGLAATQNSSVIPTTATPAATAATISLIGA